MFDLLLSGFVTLFVIIDPLGLVPLFLALTPEMNEKERQRTALRACLIAFAILTIFAFAQLWIIVRGAAAAAELGYGLLTILEVTADIGRVTGFLIQGKRQFAFFGVQEMAGGAEVLRRYDVEKNPTVSAGVAGAALHNVAFVGVTREQEPFDLAESSVLGSGGQALDGFLPRFLELVPVSGGPSGSCAPLITSLQS